MNAVHQPALLSLDEVAQPDAAPLIVERREREIASVGRHRDSRDGAAVRHFLDVNLRLRDDGRYMGERAAELSPNIVRVVQEPLLEGLDAPILGRDG